MKFKLAAIGAAAALLSGVAHADITSGTSVNNGSVSLIAVDITTNNWYMRDTGFLLNDFLPSSVTTASGDGAVTGNRTPDAGLTLNASNTASFADASFSAWVASTTGASNIRWQLVGYDLAGLTSTNVRRMLTSSANANEVITNGTIDTFVATGNVGGLSNFFNPGGLSRTGTGFAAGFYNATTLAGAFGLGADALATLGQGVSLYYASRSTGTGSTATAANVTVFGNSSGRAVVTLGADGNFSYVLGGEVAAVPLPAAALLLGAGLAGMGGLVRRRKEEGTAQA